MGSEMCIRDRRRRAGEGIVGRAARQRARCSARPRGGRAAPRRGGRGGRVGSHVCGRELVCARELGRAARGGRARDRGCERAFAARRHAPRRAHVGAAAGRAAGTTHPRHGSVQPVRARSRRLALSAAVGRVQSRKAAHPFRPSARVPSSPNRDRTRSHLQARPAVCRHIRPPSARTRPLTAPFAGKCTRGTSPSCAGRARVRSLGFLDQ